jgi:hypothetical protein
VAGYALEAAALNSDGEAVTVVVLTSERDRRKELRCSTVPMKVSAATSFVLGDDLRGGGRGEAAACTEEDAAAWCGLPNRGDDDFGPELSEQW